MNRILFIDDDINFGKLIKTLLQKNEYEVTLAYNGIEGLNCFQNNGYDIIIVDLQMPQKSGIEVIREIRKTDKRALIILITAYGDIETALKACEIGADDYLTKEFTIERLLFILKKNIGFRKLQQENNLLRQELVNKFQFKDLVVHSSKMEDIMKVAVRVASSDATVLILGESGTGKELVARLIHYNSQRKDKPLVTINCPSIPDNLLESELFGHVKGAFTGAIRERRGKFELANNGTIFLDEIGDLQKGLQSKLLRVLQEHEIERLGDSKTIKIDVRVIAATHKNLRKLVEEGKFRQDLYYRLNVIPIMIPPLRKRKEEIPSLIDFFINRYGNGQKFSIDPEVIEVFKRYEWPGNVRELENIIERAVVLSNDGQIRLDNLSLDILDQSEGNFDIFKNIQEVDFSLENIEKLTVEEALNRSNGNKSQAARILGIPRHRLVYLIKKLNL